MPGEIAVFTDGNFSDEVLQSEIPVLVDFWAEWCAPCLMIAPVLDKLADEYSGRVKFGRLNVDENQNTAAEYSIRAIPTLLLFNGGRVVDKIVGVVPTAQIKRALDAVAG